MTTVHASTDASIVAQLLVGGIGVQGLFIQTQTPEATMLQTLLGIETAVQAVELAFYVLLIRRTAVEDMARVRYLDWAVTTPVMLLTTMVYLSGKTSLADYFRAHGEATTFVVVANALMLVFGYLGEVGAMDASAASLLGFAAFAAAFRRMHVEFGSSRFLNGMTLLWSLYGVAALLPDAPKNVSINALDVVAKNFFGVFLYVELLRQNKKLMTTHGSAHATCVLGPPRLSRAPRALPPGRLHRPLV